MSIGKFAKCIGVNVATLRRMEKRGELLPDYVSPGGTRYYSKQQLNQFYSIRGVQRVVIGYCRVCTPSQKDDLAAQVNNVKTYMIAKGYQFDIIEDIGSGINYDREGLKLLINRISNREVSRVVIQNKDRLIRFGFEMIEYLCEINDVEIEVIDHAEKYNEQELTDDLVQIITVFANGS